MPEPFFGYSIMKYKTDLNKWKSGPYHSFEVLVLLDDQYPSKSNFYQDKGKVALAEGFNLQNSKLFFMLSIRTKMKSMRHQVFQKS
jgi:hypothetical protein